VDPLKNPRPSLELLPPHSLRIFQGLQASGRDLNGPNTQACRGNWIQRIETCSHSPRRGTEPISKQLTTVDRIISLSFDSLPGPFPDPPKPPHTTPPAPGIVLTTKDTGNGTHTQLHCLLFSHLYSVNRPVGCVPIVLGRPPSAAVEARRAPPPRTVAGTSYDPAFLVCGLPARELQPPQGRY